MDNPKDVDGRISLQSNFRAKAVLPPKVVFPILRVEHFEPEASEAGLRENLDLFEEVRVEFHLRALIY
ncbi:hypothetical protein BHM03_00009062 [Ensete ventricosum]|nr:hypothetical protein BHM03_00009062 [Ensete ventricosum]